MFRCFVAALALVAMLSCSSGHRPKATETYGNGLIVGPCTVTRVVDGDTVSMECGTWLAPCEKWPTVRLLNLNTPERREAGFAEASVALEEMVSGEKIHLTFAKPLEATCGYYDRLLAYLFVEGKNINVEMVRQGWSPYWVKYGKGRYPEAFDTAADEARRSTKRSSR